MPIANDLSTLYKRSRSPQNQPSIPFLEKVMQPRVYSVLYICFCICSTLMQAMQVSSLTAGVICMSGESDQRHLNIHARSVHVSVSL